MEHVAQEIRGFIVDNFLFGKEGKLASDDDSFMDKGIIDSTGVMELVSYLEQKYSIEVLDEELVPANLDSVRKVTAYVCRKLQHWGKALAG